MLTKSEQCIIDSLELHGVDVNKAREVLLTGKNGFTINFGDLSPQHAYVVCGQIRSLLYSWLHLLGIKPFYTIRRLPVGIQVLRKVHGTFATVATVEHDPATFSEVNTELCSVMQPEDDFDIDLLSGGTGS